MRTPGRHSEGRNTCCHLTFLPKATTYSKEVFPHFPPYLGQYDNGEGFLPYVFSLLLGVFLASTTEWAARWNSSVKADAERGL